MKTDKRDTTASIILNYFLQFLGVAAFYWLLIYTTINYWFHDFLFKITKVRYEAGVNFTKELYFILLIFALFCYFANKFILDLYHTKTGKQLIISMVFDYLVWPLQVLIMLVYNNMHIDAIVKDIGTLLNVFLITILIVLKTVIAVKLLSGKTAKAENAKS